jgi:hypothetical protein
MITRADLAVLQAFLESGFAKVRSLGLDLVLDPHLSRWAEHMRSAPGITTVNPTFDPAESEVDPTNSFWIGLVDPAGRILACTAARLFLVDDFRDLVVSQRLWYGRGPRTLQPLTVALPEGLGIGGRVVHEGGMWVHPTERNRGLARLLCPILRGVAMRNWDVDWYTGISIQGLITSGFFAKGYHYSLIAPFSTGWFPPLGREADFWLTYMPRAESLAQMRAWVEAERDHAVDGRSGAGAGDGDQKPMVGMPVV